jgi:O-antigen/teichoic acid export membrane protein
MLIVLAKLGSAEMVGQFALGVAIASPVIALSGLQLRAIQATDAGGRYHFGHYFGLRLLTTAVAILVIAAMALGYRREVMPVLLAVGLAKAIESISDILFGLLQNRQRMDRIAVSMMVKGVLSLAALGGAVAMWGSLFWGVAAVTAVWTAVLLAYDIPNALRVLAADPGPIAAPTAHAGCNTAGCQGVPGSALLLRPCFDPRPLVRLAWFALPLGVVMLLLSLNANIPRYFMERHGGDRALGILAALSYLSAAGYQVVSALGQAASPRLARYHHQGARPAFRRLLLRFVALMIAIGVAGVVAALVAGRPLLRFLYRPEYAEYHVAFVWIMAAGGVSYVCAAFGFAATARQQLAQQPPILLAVVAVSLVSSWWLVPAWGVLGAAVSMAASSAFCAAGYAYLSIREN